MGAESSPARHWDGLSLTVPVFPFPMSLPVFQDPPAREVMKYIYSLHCSCGVLVALTHLGVLIQAAHSMLVQLWFSRTAHVSYCQPAQSRAERPGTAACSGAVCLLQFPQCQRTLPARELILPYPNGHNLDL